MASDHLSECEQRLLAKLQSDHAIQNQPKWERLPNGRWRMRGGPRMPRSTRASEPKPGTTAAIISSIEQCGPRLSAERAMLWANEMFPPDQVKAWLESGLRTTDLALITDFRALGIHPEAMCWKVRGETMLDRIRVHHYSAHTVARTLQNAGLLRTRKSA